MKKFNLTLCCVTQSEGGEQGQIRIAHVEEDVLRRSGASLLTVEHSSAEQRKSWTPEGTTVRIQKQTRFDLTAVEKKSVCVLFLTDI